MEYLTTSNFQDGTTFYIVGGFNYDDNVVVDTILEFDPIGEGWRVREERLQNARELSFAVAVDASKVNCS